MIGLVHQLGWRNHNWRLAFIRLAYRHVCGNIFLIASVVVWMLLAPIRSQEVVLLGGVVSLESGWFCWRKCISVAVGFEMSFVQALLSVILTSLPVACRSRCRTLESFSSTISVLWGTYSHCEPCDCVNWMKSRDRASNYLTKINHRESERIQVMDREMHK